MIVLDPLSVGVGMLAVLVARRLVGRRRRARPQQPAGQPEVQAVCQPCQRGFETEQTAVDHALDAHKAPDKAAARAIIEVPDS